MKIRPPHPWFCSCGRLLEAEQRPGSTCATCQWRKRIETLLDGLAAELEDLELAYTARCKLAELRDLLLNSPQDSQQRQRTRT